MIVFNQLAELGIDPGLFRGAGNVNVVHSILLLRRFEASRRREIESLRF